MKFRLEIPAEWDNRMARKTTNVTWIFTVNEEGKRRHPQILREDLEIKGMYCLAGSVLAKDTGGKKTAHVKTGDSFRNRNPA